MSGPETEPQPHLIRLQRYLAACGIGSRRACEEYITAGRVTVDRKVVSELGTKVDPQAETVALDGEVLRMQRKKYYLLNKPAGVLCTNRDEQGRPRVIDLFPRGGPRLFTVGRLDESSEGLLIVTNDGDLAQKLAHPRHRIFRTYEVQVAGHPTREQLNDLKKGVHFAEGKFQAWNVRPLKKQGKSTHIEIVLTEGRNRELRRMFARIGHKVLKLKRVGFGSLRLGKLAPGEYRELRREELAGLHELLAKTGQHPARERRRMSRRKRAASRLET
jgi:23S rRNA pseudouridine2605 synthase